MKPLKPIMIPANNDKTKKIISAIALSVGAIILISVLYNFLIYGNEHNKEKAMKLYQQNEYDKAAELFKKIGDDKMYANSLSYRGEELILEGNLEQAAIYFDKIMSINEHFVPMGNSFTVYLEALDAIEQEEYVKANDLLNDLVKTRFADSSKIQNSIKEPLQRIKELEKQNEINVRNEQLSKYLTSIGYRGIYIVNKEKTPDANVISLLTQDFFIANKKATAELIGKNQCYEVVMVILNNLYQSYPIEKPSYPYYHNENLEEYGSNGYFVDFETLLWSIILLPDLDLPGAYNAPITSAFLASWREWLSSSALLQRGFDFRNKMKNCFALAVIDCNDLELLMKLYPSEFDVKTLEYSIICTDIHEKFFDAIIKTFNYLEYGPKRIFTQREYANLLGNDFVPSNPMDNEYIRIVDFSELTPAFINIANQGNFNNPEFFQENMVLNTSRKENGLFSATNPNNARFAIYEKLTVNYIGEYILSNSTERFKVYLPIWDVKIIDLKNGETILIDKQTLPVKEQYLNIYANSYSDNIYIPFNELDKNKYINFMTGYCN